MKLLKLFLFLMLTVHVSAQKPKRDIALLADTPVDISLINTTKIIKIPVLTPEGFDWKKMIIYPIDLPPSMNGIETAFEGDTLANVFVKLTIGHVYAPKPGSFHITLVIQQRPPADTPVNKQLLKLPILVKPPVVTVTPVVNAVRINSFPGLGFPAFGSELFIDETSSASSLGSFIIKPTGTLTDEKGFPVNASVTFSGQDSGVIAGKQVSLPYHFTGSLPLGKTIGNFQVVSPALNAPIPFRMEITTRLGAFYLFLIIALGLLSGYFLRTYLEYNIQLDNARLKAIALLKRISQEQSTRPDKPFQDALTALANDINAHLSEINAETITAAITAAETALANRIADFNARMTDIEAKLKTTGSMLNTSWTLPPAFGEIVQNAINSLNAAIEKYKAGNPTDAASQLGETDRLLLNNLKAAASVYRNTLLADLSLIENSSLKLPAVSESLTSLKSSAQSIPVNDIAVTNQALLTNVHDTNFQAGELAKTVLEKTGVVVGQVLSGFENSGLTMPDAAALQTLRTTTDHLRQKLNSMSVGVEALNELAVSLSMVLNALKLAIMSQVSAIATDPEAEKANVPRRKQTADYIAASDYQKATSEALDFLIANGAKPLSNSRALTASINFQTPELSMRALAPAPATQGKLSMDTVQIPQAETLESFSKRTYRNLLASKFLQFVFSSIGLIFVGYVVFADSFIGTPNNFASAFFWAFTLDISVSTLVSQAGRFGKPA